MSDDILYLVFVIILLIAMLAYMYIKDKESAEKITKLQNAIEDITKELHYFKKESDDEEESVKQSIDNDFVKNELKNMLEQELGNKILPILKSIRAMETIIEEFQNEQKNRLLSLEQKAQSITKLTPNYDVEEQKVIALFKEGKSIEQIAKDLRIGIGNVELVLKFKQLIK
ncbi:MULTISPECIES: DUF6115 domain-containing protein [unclassified Campylobacter]|uniref:DUF6115 domain-containing protein n=1 Tax=unclassified Campylobacter TaxID=2593542 RepID=UPI001237C927|nr:MULTISPECIES: hypothetical protein [unclassified Campylobacter]KAA6225227.1 hypothetical protein FMM55_08120 [Campylobacter sp. LR196d]KAA6226238.1 hypothetical protein FMM54_05495 [Campylobacter sp. LR185c]KAA6228961.1 hypothetical protein FMM57_01750 [Campylobacter sp. LR286c]KAA6231440.1 hypothetical protein FMM56_04645 [Campylobacter sp. LR264d]KAA6231652.1 hypothetical protein FMM58_03435 [Campylobacter sp. LR291e]